MERNYNQNYNCNKKNINTNSEENLKLTKYYKTKNISLK